MVVIMKEGNLLDSNEQVIGHQVNCQGIMGGGIARQMRETYPLVYKVYSEYTRSKSSPEELLGKNLMITTNGDEFMKGMGDGTKIVSNLYGQLNIGRGKKQTCEKSLELALMNLKNFSKKHNVSVALPYRLGCGLGGGDWSEVFDIIERVFDDYEVTIYKLP